MLLASAPKSSTSSLAAEVRRQRRVHAAYLSGGEDSAYKLFHPHFPGYDDADPPLPRLGGTAEYDSERFLKYELLSFFSFNPDLRRVKGNGVSAALAYGKLSGNALFARATIELASILECQRYPFPGNYPSYGYEPKAFGAEVLTVFGEMEEKERMKGVRLKTVSGLSQRHQAKKPEQFDLS
jgi:hypothetical protein